MLICNIRGLRGEKDPWLKDAGRTMAESMGLIWEYEEIDISYLPLLGINLQYKGSSA